MTQDLNPDRHQDRVAWLLDRLQDVPGFVGRSAARKYRRRMFPFALREMDRRLAAMEPGDVCRKGRRGSSHRSTDR